MKICIGSDHRGFELKENIIEFYKNYEWIDVGTDSSEVTDYPLYAQAVCAAILEKKVDSGILLCGSGIGISIAANRFKGIYAALCWSPEVARLAKEDDNVNVLVLPADFISLSQAVSCIDIWQKTAFKGGRYAKRLNLIDAA